MSKKKVYPYRYHEDFFMPEGIQDECIRLCRQNTPHRFTYHVLKNLKKRDKSHAIKGGEKRLKKLLRKLELNWVKPFEVYADKDKHPKKYAMRIEMSESEDVIFVLSDRVVITYYINNKNDPHHTLGNKENPYSME